MSKEITFPEAVELYKQFVNFLDKNKPFNQAVFAEEAFENNYKEISGRIDKVFEVIAKSLKLDFYSHTQYINELEAAGIDNTEAYSEAMRSLHEKP